MEAWEDNHFKSSELPNSICVNGEWAELKNMDLSQVEYLIIWHHKSSTKDFSDFPELPKLKYLEINWSNITSLNGIEKFSSLKRFEVHNGTKLEAIEHICSLKQNIEHIHFNVCKKITDHQKIICCKQLKTLCFNECGKIEGLNFLSYLLKLEDFRFVHTNILDGNLMPLLEHKKLTSAGFINKRHYSHKDIQVKQLLNSKIG